jgi:MFS family permease
LPRAFWVLFVGTLVNRIGGFVLVFLAIYLTEVRGLTSAQAGLIVSAYGLGALVGGPFGGAVSDRIGRRATLVASLLAGGVSMLALGTVTRPAAIAAMAVVTGLLYEMYRPVVSASVADLVGPEDRRGLVVDRLPGHRRGNCGGVHGAGSPAKQNEQRGVDHRRPTRRMI